MLKLICIEYMHKQHIPTPKYFDEALKERILRMHNALKDILPLDCACQHKDRELAEYLYKKSPKSKGNPIDFHKGNDWPYQVYEVMNRDVKASYVDEQYYWETN